jgi:hypothetical protein
VIITRPRKITLRSIATPARLLRKRPMAIAADTAPPIRGSSPNIASVPRPAPLMLPTLNTSPPMSRSAAIAYPRPGATRLPSSWARRPETPMIRQMFICRAMSTRIDTAMAKANATPSSTVKAVVWVMNPGPIAEVAIRNIAPIRVERVLEDIFVLIGASAGGGVRSGCSAGVGDIGAPEANRMLRTLRAGPGCERVASEAGTGDFR